MYRAPVIEDFGRIEHQVHTVFSPPNGELPPENGISPAFAPASDAAGGLFGLVGLAAGVAAIAGRDNNATEPVAGPLEEPEEIAKVFE